MEILAPAGSISALKAAIKGGADAVYLGLGEHNARIKSNDFNTDNLSEWVGYAHLFGVKVYVTLNTAVKDEELSRVLALAKVAAESGADALIVSDLGVASMLSAGCDVPLHLSTQAGVQNSLDVLALKGLRIKRVILARETPLEDIREIKKYIDEVEIFVQGAVCVAFSGGCLLGSKIYGASGNRGVCNQGCRLNYTAYDESGKELKRGKLLSPCDLSLGEKVKELAAYGVDSVKIEGRLKRPLYVYSATKYYRDLLDGKDAKETLRDLQESFNRGFIQGYTLNKSAKVINPLTSSHVGVPVGTIEKVVDRKGFKFALVRSEYEFVKGDGAKILQKGIEVGGSDVTSVRLVGGLQEIPVSDGAAPHDVVCLTTNARKASSAERIVNTRPVDFVLKGNVGEKLTLTARSGAYSVSVCSETTADASRSSDNEALLQKLSKVGGTDFVLQSLRDESTAPLYLNPSDLASMKRRVLSALRDMIIAGETPMYSFREAPVVSCVEEKVGILRVVEVEDIDEPVCRSADAFVLNPKRIEVSSLKQTLTLAEGRPCYLRLPKVLREKELQTLREWLGDLPDLGIYADNLYAVELARQMGRRYIAGLGLNVFNKATVSLFPDADHICGSIECAPVGDLAFVAGKVRLMNFAHCPFSVVYGTRCATCDRSHDRLYYENGDHRYLILRREFSSCDFTMLEDAVTHYPVPKGGISRYYSFIGLNPEEKRVMMRCVSEEYGE